MASASIPPSARDPGRGLLDARAFTARAEPRDSAEAGLPDPIRVGDDPTLTPVALNRAVTAGYAALAGRVQAIVDATWAAGESSTYPVWLAFGAHASRQDGVLLEAVKLAREALVGSSGAEATTSRAGDRRDAPSSGRADESSGPHREGLGERLSAAATLARDLVPGSGSGFDAAPLLDPIVLVSTLRGAGALAETAPGRSPGARLGALLDTLENALVEANRAIYREIGGLVAGYLRRRGEQGAPRRPEDAIAAFGPEVDAATARALVDRARALAAQRAATPGSDESVRPGTPGAALHVGEAFVSAFPLAGTRELLAAAFVLFEEAATTEAGAGKNALVAVGNELIGFGEQYFVVPKSFLRPLQPGEVDRKALFAALSPLLELPLHGRTWRFADAARRVLPRAGILAPAPLGHNWAIFADRWPAILDFFALCYRHPEAVWPLPAG